MEVRELESALKHKLGSRNKSIGVYTSDILPIITYNTKPIILIANTLKSTANINTVGHWVAIYFEFQPIKRLIFFDSYSLSPDFYINSGFSKFLRKYRGTPIYHFGTQFQPDNSMKCGLYVSLFVHYTSLYRLVFYIVDSIKKKKRKKKEICHIMINMLQDIISNIYQNHPVHIGKMEIREP